MPKGGRHIAFLRGINVGGHRVKMDVLRRVFEDLGFSNVSTFIASGNVIFEAAARQVSESRIETALRGALGYEAPTFVRTPDDLKTIVAYRPFAAKDLENPDYRLHVCFLRRELDTDRIQALPSFETPIDTFHARGRELYWLCRGPLNQSLVKWKQMEKRVPGPSTARNITMLRRLVQSLEDD